jgi:hypothetical protein
MLRWLHKWFANRGIPGRPAQPLQLEALEPRLALSLLPVPTAQPLAPTPLTLSSAGPFGFSPAQIRHAYGFDQIRFGGAEGDGAGQTIAIIGAYDNPNILHDLTQFDQALGLPDPPGFAKVNQTGGSAFPPRDPKGTWELEAALDVEWAHALAPGARILLVEANTGTFDDLDAAVDYARHQPDVSVVSMSFGSTEFAGETALDHFFTTPPGRSGVTFIASTGDASGVTEYPASSPNVLAVGGTSLTLNASGAYAAESAWGDGGGGLSPFEARPAYQNGVAGRTGKGRITPDVAFDADPETGVPVYDSFNNGTETPWVEMGGTSFAAPAWAALVAITDQGRALAGMASLDGPTQTIPAVYELPAGDFHDVTGGRPAVPGYDPATGRGSPVAYRFANDLVPAGNVATHFRVVTTTAWTTAGTALAITVTALDANNNPVVGYHGTVHFKSSDARAGLPADYTFTARDGGRHTFTVTFKTAGSQTLRLIDKASATGGMGVNVNPGKASSLRIVVPASVTAGVPFRVTVDAVDAFGNLATGYLGTVNLDISNSHTRSAQSYSYRTGNRGAHTFIVTLASAGTWTLYVQDPSQHFLHAILFLAVRKSASLTPLPVKK